MSIRNALFAGAASTLCLFSIQAAAADLNEAQAPAPFAGQVSAGYTTLSTDVSAFTGETTIDATTLHADGALLYRLDPTLNVQADFAYHDHEVDTGRTYDSWHIGGAIFQRDASKGMLGLAASRGRTGTHVSYTDHYVAGPIAEFYREEFTLGTRANYTRLNIIGAPVLNSGDISLYGIAYLNSDISLKLSGTYANAKTGAAVFDFYAGSGEAEYRAADSMSLFIRGQYSKNNERNVPFSVADTQAVFGARFYFNSDSASLKSLHRSTTINNTTEWVENSSYGGLGK